MSGSPPSTPTSRYAPAAASPDRPRIKTPHPKVFDSPNRLTPRRKLNLHLFSTDSAFSPLKTIEPSDTSDGETQDVELLEITTIEKANEVFETAVYYLDAAYSNPAQPKYELLSRAQNLLHQVLYSLEDKINWRLRAFCKIEMARASFGSYYQHYWIQKGLNDLDIYFQTNCLLIKNRNLDLVEEIKNCRATYLNISEMCQENFADLSEHALKKQQECESYLQQLHASVEATSPASDEESSTPQAIPPAKDKPSTVNKTKAVFFFSMSLLILGLTFTQKDRLKHIISELFTITMINCVRPGWVILSQSFPKTESLKLLL